MLSVRNARVHNLRGVDVDLPRGRLIVVTGPSGSGKSSLAFDTIHAEGERRLVEALRLRQRTPLARLPRPACDAVHGLTPTIAVAQLPPHALPRETVGTTSELFDILRTLAGRVGVLHCPDCDAPVVPSTPAGIASHIEAAEEGTRLLLLAPLAPGTALSDLVQRGFSRIRHHGAVLRLDDPATERMLTDGAPFEVVVDRLVVRPGSRARIIESIETALTLGGGVVLLAHAELDAPPARFSTLTRCMGCELDLPRLSPDLFLHSTPTSRGACRECRGIGSAATRSNGPSGSDAAAEEPLVPNEPCSACGGAHLGPVPRAVRLGGVAMATLLLAPLETLGVHLDALEAALSGDLRAVVREGLGEARSRLRSLLGLGLGHLALARAVGSLSAGEAQRLRLAAQLGADLAGVTYVLDEPSNGLHPSDVGGLLRALVALRDQGNTVLVVEHDPAIIAAADWVVDLGPAAGEAGGEVVATGTVPELRAAPGSVTGPWLHPRRLVPVPARLPEARDELRLEGARLLHLRGQAVNFPVGALTAVTGVSGAGKSALVFGALAATARASLGLGPASPLAGRLHGASAFARVVRVDGPPPGRSQRSIVATWTGVFDEIRRLYAAVPEARAAGFNAARFSFNTAGGRCEPCRGEGVMRLDMGFLSDVDLPCEACGGRRYDEPTLAIRYRGLDIAELLALSVDSARPMFRAIPAIVRVLDALAAVGLGYLRLGQPGAALSGGEAQRLRIARELARPGSGPALFLLDEPSRGLHPVDLVTLVEALRRLADAGHTVVLTEHAPHVIAACDHVIDLGPGPGAGGGEVLAAGHPLDIATHAASATGRHLADLLAVAP
jgi:excinuclease ABC subunit A